MAFIRVVADVRVEFDGVRAPIERKGLELGTGSGFVVAPSGLILTSLHVVAEDEAKSRFREDEAEVSIGNRRIEVAIGTGGEQGVFEAHVVASDVENDLAALQVTAAELAYLPLGDSDAIEAGRPVKVLGFPFGRQVEVGRRADKDVVPEVTVTAGSLSAARADEEGDTRFLQTDATVNPGNSGGPMLDEDGYVVGVVRMKLARDATSQGAGFSVPVNVVKDFLDASGLSAQLPVTRLRPGVRHTLDWKRLAIELPDGYSDQSTSRVLADAGEVGEIGFRAYRLATAWSVAAMEEALLGGRELPGFVPAPATAGRRETPGRRGRRSRGGAASQRHRLGGGGRRSGGRSASSTRSWTEGDEKVVARYLGPADAVAFNLGLVRRSLRSLEAGPMLLARHPAPWSPGTPALERVSLPEGDGQVLTPAGWSREPATQSACLRLPRARQRPGVEPSFGLHAGAAGAAVDRRPSRARPGGRGLWRGAGRGAPGTGESRYALRFARLGVPIEARGVLVVREGESLLLELEAPVAKLEVVEGLYDRWVREVAAAR